MNFNLEILLLKLKVHDSQISHTLLKYALHSGQKYFEIIQSHYFCSKYNGMQKQPNCKRNMAK